MAPKSKITVLSLIFLCILFNLNTANVKALDVFGNTYNGIVNPNETIDLNFINFNKRFMLTADVYVNFSIKYFSPLLSRQTALVINNSAPISLNISFDLNIEAFLSKLPEEPTLEDMILNFRYNSVMRIISNSTIDNLKFQFEKNSLLGLYPDQNYTLVYYHSIQESWELISTAETYNNKTSKSYLEGTFSNLNGNEEYFITIYNVNEESEYVPEPYPLIWIFIISLIIIIVISVILIISKEEYINYIKNRLNYRDKGCHRLSLDEVLENQNRSKIIDLILENPGIHFNEILRETELSPGNLVWHLDILEKYKIISKRYMENYVLYFPLNQKNPISNLELKLQKSELTLKILKIIKQDPGVWNSLITKKLKINRKTIAYHIKKLKDLELIEEKREGSKKKIYPTDNVDDIFID
jgi:predicted transcriptional regulator